MLLCYNWYVFNQGRRFRCHELMRSHQMSAWSTLKHLNAFPGCVSPSPSPRLPSLPPTFHLSPCILLIFPGSLFGSSRLAFVLGSIWWDYATSGSISCPVIHFTSAYFWRFPEALTPVYRQTEPIQPPHPLPTPFPPTTLSVEMKPNGSVGSRMQRGQCEFAVLACR